MTKDSLGDRMKEYENVQRLYLTRRTPTIIRLDGKSFHSFTRGFERPFDMIFMRTMWATAKYLCENIMGCKIAYTQSDEITLLLTDYDNITTDSWFDKNIVKMTSVSASMATVAFNEEFIRQYRLMCSGCSEKDALGHDICTSHCHKYKYRYNIEQKIIGSSEGRMRAMFDSRVFNIPKEEVTNCFIWRQQDATRNAIQMVGQSEFSHKKLQNKNCNQIQEMLWQEKGINFNNFPTYQKRGSCVIKETYNKEEVERNRWIIDKDIPIFTQDREYIEKYL